MAFRLLLQKPTYFDSAGAILAFGSLEFYVTGTSTAKSVYAEPALSTDLGHTISLDADGKHSEDLWLAEDTAYRVVAKDSDGNTEWQLDNVRNTIGSGISPPDPTAGTDGQALLTDGTAWYFQTLREVPDPTGYTTNALLKTDGDLIYWEEQAAATVDSGVSATSSGYIWSNGVLQQWGSGTCSSTGSLSVTTSITFGQAFDAAPYHVSIEPVLSSGVTSNSPSGFPATRYSSPSTTGCTAGFFVGEENTGGTDTINANIPFTWFAIGPKAAAP